MIQVPFELKTVRVRRVLNSIKSRLVIHHVNVTVNSLTGINEIGRTNLRQPIIGQIPHLAKGIVTPVLGGRLGLLLQKRPADNLLTSKYTEP